ncbi:choice-of-anchor R domain-containing protein [Candidatus Poriferisodalis sp.]|uniref:choice-of-anchor R domain-containing protein n=1 Tax=Candidatus Poriferisodalis sp. TaxID=3101277 RepID=UPI003B01922E
MGALLVPLSSAEAQTPTEPVLVSNLGQTGASSDLAFGLFDVAQAFSTGGNAAGYTLSSVDVRFSELADAAAASKVTVSVHAEASGRPGAVVGALTWPSFTPFTSSQTLRFAAPAGGISLAADSTYFVVFDTDITGVLSGRHLILVEVSGGEDAGGAPGFSIADGSFLRTFIGAVAWVANSGAWRIAVNGVAVGAAPSGLVSAPSVVFVREGETVSVRLDLAQEVTASVPVSAASSDVSRFKVSHPRSLHMPGGRRVQTQSAPSGSIDFSFDAQDWAGYGPDSVKGYRVVEVTALRSGAGGQPGTSPDAVFDLVLSSTDSSVVLPSVKVVVQRGQGALDPRFDPDPSSDGDCRYVQCLVLGEGGSTSYTVRNFNVPAPGSPVTITPTLASGSGVVFDPPVVSWSSVDDYLEERTITVTAVEDADMDDEDFVVRHVFSENWDTNGWLSKELRNPARELVYTKAEQESRFNMAGWVGDDDKPDISFPADPGAPGAEVAELDLNSNSGGAASFQIVPDSPPLDCASRDRPYLCRETLYIRLQRATGSTAQRADGQPETDVTRTVWTIDYTSPGVGTATSREVTKKSCQWGALPRLKERQKLLAADPNADVAHLDCVNMVTYDRPPFIGEVDGEQGYYFARRITSDNWNQPITVGLAMVSGYGGSGHFDVSMSLTRYGDPSAKRTIRVNYGPGLTSENLEVPAADSDDTEQQHVADGHQQPDRQPQVQPGQLDQPQPADPQQTADSQQQPQQPAPYVVDPALIAEVEAHIASFKARGHQAGVRDWTAVLDRLEGRSDAMSDEDIAAWLARSQRHGWADGIGTLPKVQAALTAQAAAQAQQQQQPQQPQDPPPPVPEVVPDTDPPQPVPYAADPQVVAAVQHLASQTHHGFAHVNRWQRALAAIGALDPAAVDGGALTLAEAKQNTHRYSSPVWGQVVTEIEAKAAHDTSTG